MGFNLFQSTEEKMKQTMFRAISPVGKDIQLMLDSEGSINGEPLYMGEYKSASMYKRPQQEIHFLKNALMNKKVGLVLFEDSGVFFADIKEVLRFKDQMLNAIEKEEGNWGRGHAWMSLMRLFWDNKIPISHIRVYLEGFEMETFVNGQKVKKDFIERPPWPLR